jgi:signal transduction histidine kinase
MTPRRSDRLIAAGLAVAACVEVAFERPEGPLVLNLLAALGYTLPLAYRRTHPLPALVAIFSAALVMAWWLTPMQRLFVPLLVVLVAAYSAGHELTRGRAWASLAVLCGGMLGVIASMPQRGPDDFFFPTMFMIVAWLSGRLVRSRTSLTEALHEAAARAAEDHDDSLRQAAAEERRRIAREMHDLVAHSMSVMVVQAGGARRILDRDPARALEAAAQIERTGREALAEMRQLLGMLHPGEEPRTLAPQPTLAELNGLIARARAAGLPTVLFEHGPRRPLPAGLDLAAYRIVQEALTNAIKHAGGAATEVTVTWSRTELVLDIRDHGERSGDGRSARGSGASTAREGGHGLVGMRERVRLYGGELETGRPRGGGWRVRATLPLVREMALA